MPEENPKDKVQDPDPQTQRRLLRFINAARTPETLAFLPKNEIPLEEPDPVARHPVFRHEMEEREAITDLAHAKRLLNARDDNSPTIGFTHIDDLREAIGRLDLGKWLDKVIARLGP